MMLWALIYCTLKKVKLDIKCIFSKIVEETEEDQERLTIHQMSGCHTWSKLKSSGKTNLMAVLSTSAQSGAVSDLETDAECQKAQSCGDTLEKYCWVHSRSGSSLKSCHSSGFHCKSTIKSTLVNITCRNNNRKINALNTNWTPTWISLYIFSVVPGCSWQIC